MKLTLIIKRIIGHINIKQRPFINHLVLQQNLRLKDNKETKINSLGGKRFNPRAEKREKDPPRKNSIMLKSWTRAIPDVN